ncbi:MAG: outer membrane beta-barrel protein [Candidatus Eisenbacteria bacterium]|nr:outer membrane beta-barrel protein [Candidatus Eisenbacteria bacterium]
MDRKQHLLLSNLPHVFLAACLIAVLSSIAPPPAQAYEHRRGTPSIGGQLQFGFLGINSDWADVFQPGRGVSVRVKQYISRNQALGISFEQQRFQEQSSVSLVDPECPSCKPDYLQFQTLMVDYYFYIQRPLKRTPYVIASLGFYRPEIVQEGTEDVVEPGQTVSYPNEGVLGRLGIGLEYFVARTFSLDATLSGYYLNARENGTTATTMLALGVHIYTGK